MNNQYFILKTQIKKKKNKKEKLDREIPSNFCRFLAVLG
jgi:hypothetical protein